MENLRFALLSVLLFTAIAHASPPALIPLPAEFEATGETLVLDREMDITYSGEGMQGPAELLAQRLRTATGYPVPVREGEGGTISIRLTGDDSLAAEGYVLEVAESVSIEALDPAGAFYGSQTLLQLLPPEVFSKEAVDAPWSLPGVKIRDLPRFGWRGLHLDVSRYFMPKDDVLKLIDVMASLKLNVFHWHLTDDQGWRLEIRKYPRLTEVGAWREETLVGHNRDNVENPRFDGTRHGGFYTQAEIREVVAYAAERFITVVPEVDMPGHMQAAIAAYPELGCTDEPIGVRTRWGISEYILNPEASTVQFCKDVLAEVMELFPSTFIHIGGDEAKKTQWEASERIQQLRVERGLADMHAMQSWFIRQIDDFLVANGRRLIGWDEISEGGLAKNAAVMWWRGKDGYNGIGRQSALNAIKDGHDVVVASNSHLYFDYYQSEDRENEPLAIGGYLPLEEVYAFEPVMEELTESEAARILGAQGQLWREYLPTTASVEYMAFPRACALAELVWLPPQQKDYTSFLERMKIQEQRFDAAGVNYRKIQPAEPPQEKAVPAEHPNVVIIYGDDVGYGDVGAYGSKLIPTPHLDRLASESLLFTDGHCTAATCTPSRYSLLAGIHGFRDGIRILAPNAPLTISTEILTLPKLFRKAGYSTAVVGKWHLGLGEEGTPTDWNGEVKPGPLEIGFDYSFLLPSTNDRVPCVYLENHRVLNLDPSDPLFVGRGREKLSVEGSTAYPDGRTNREAMTYYPSSHGHDDSIINGIGRIGYMAGGKSALWDDETMADEFVQRAEKFISGHKDRPFFLYFASQDIHVPRTPHPRFKGLSQLGYRGDAMVQLDWSTGEILRILEEQGLTENTIVIFSSDNGPVYDDGYVDGTTVRTSTEEVDRGHDGSGIYKGGKYQIYEGGTRVPLIIRWPGRIEPGTSNALVSQIDFIASFAGLLGVELEHADAPDSRNTLPAFLGTDAAGLDFMIEEAGNRIAIRQGDWKYIIPMNGNNRQAAGTDPQAALYDLSTDPGESRNIIEGHPDLAASLDARLRQLIDAGRLRP